MDFVIPDIYCPFSSLISPHLEAVRAHAREWLSVHAPVLAQSPFLTSDVPWMVCGIYQSAGLEELCLCSDWYSWGFTFDDLCDNSGLGRRLDALEQIQARFLAVLQEVPPVSIREPVVAMLYDIWQRARKRTSATWQQRFVYHHAEYFASLLLETTNRLEQHMPSLQAYIANRRLTAASTVCLDLIELVRHIEIPVEVYESQSFQDVLISTYDVVHWTNDVYSLSKELTRGEVNNLVVVVQHEEGGSWEDATRRVCAMINRETQRFQDLVLLLPSYPTEVDRIVRTYLIDVGHYIRTAFDYERVGSRYTYESSIAPKDRNVDF
jgi:terpene synthase-like protein